MRVLMINTVCGTGSTGRICTDIANGVIAKGDECLICYGRGEGQGFDNTYKIGAKFSFYVHAIKTRLWDRHGLSGNRDTKRLIKKIIEYNPDIIHLHNIHGYFLNYKILFRFLAEYDRPIVWTLHDCWAFTGHCAYFDYCGCDKWKTECRNCQLKKEYPASKFLSAAKSNFNLKKLMFTLPKNMTIITPSEWLKNLVENSFLNKYQVQIINNGIDVSAFKPIHSEIRKKLGVENKFVILAVANIWNERKGIDDVLKLANMLSENEILILVGKTLKKITHEKIILIERTNNVIELAKMYTAADVVINPTYEDNYPTVNLEAQACGTPVLTYSTGGSVESVPEENVIEKGQVDKLYAAISTKLCIRDIDFDKSNMIKSYMEVYSEKYGE